MVISGNINDYARVATKIFFIESFYKKKIFESFGLKGYRNEYSEKMIYEHFKKIFKSGDTNESSYLRLKQGDRSLKDHLGFKYNSIKEIVKDVIKYRNMNDDEWNLLFLEQKAGIELLNVYYNYKNFHLDSENTDLRKILYESSSKDYLNLLLDKHNLQEDLYGNSSMELLDYINIENNKSKTNQSALHILTGNATVDEYESFMNFLCKYNNIDRNCANCKLINVLKSSYIHCINSKNRKRTCY